jgi:outer membrane protein OmpA-like peptidoglycan-associated protein
MSLIKKHLLKSFCFVLFIMQLHLPAFSQKTDTVYIHFPFNKHELINSEVSKIKSFITEYNLYSGESNIELRGHTDFIGTDTYNQLLSEKRVSSVMNYLLNNGISSSHFKMSKGFGENEPLNDNSNDIARQQNRRVEIIWQQIEKVVEQQDDPSPMDTVREFTREAIDTAREGQTLRLRNINFYGGRHTFLPQAMPALNQLLDVMKANPSLEIEIQGHICCRYGSREDGMDYDAGDNRLSHNRARAVYYYLAENGIDKRRMTYKGFAGEFPLVFPEYTEADRTLNRRVEIKIVKK